VKDFSKGKTRMIRNKAMELSTFSPETQLAYEMAINASALTNRYFRGSLELRDKGNNAGIVTEADEKCEDFLRHAILKSFPNHCVLGEESGISVARKNDNTLLELPMWILDPIDGTTNFANGNSYHCISIAFGYEVSSVFHPKSACIVRPFLNEFFLSEVGKGSFVKLGNSQWTSLQVSNVEILKQATVATGFSSHHGNELNVLSALFGKVHAKCRGLRINGAAALDLAYTAQATIGAFFEAKLNPWDMAAGDLLVTEAGGICLNYEGEKFNALKDANIVAGPKALVNQLLQIIHD
jgi:myo-inositol-1(or 4)-monophosphatase